MSKARWVCGWCLVAWTSSPEDDHHNVCWSCGKIGYNCYDPSSLDPVERTTDSWLISLQRTGPVQT